MMYAKDCLPNLPLPPRQWISAVWRSPVTPEVNAGTILKLATVSHSHRAHRAFSQERIGALEGEGTEGKEQVMQMGGAGFFRFRIFN